MQQNSSYVVPSYPQLNNNSSKQIPNKELIPNKTNLNNQETKHLLFFSHYCNHSKKLLNELYEYCGGDREIMVARELAKKFEEHIGNNINEVIEFFNTKNVIGEITIVLKGINKKRD